MLKNRANFKKNYRKLEGVVISNKMNKTVVVKVDRNVVHPKYHKRYVRSRRYKCHDAKNQYKVGERVILVECRPYSKEKRWRIISKIG
jgi:small subunit ribosomal protein S17